MKSKYILLSFLLLFSATLLSAQEVFKLSHGPYLQNMKPDEVTIVWMSSSPSIGWIEVAPDDKSNFYAKERPKYFDTRDGVKRTSTLHSVKISGLNSNTRYRYRAYVREVTDHKGNQVAYGKTSATEVYGKEPLSFITPDPQRQNINFAMVSDIHGNNDRLQKLIGQCNLKNTDFVIFNGDMVSVLNEENHIFDGFMDKAIELFASEIPMYYTRGNHETRGAYAPYFHDYFSVKEPTLYYTFRQGPICFVILDTGEDKPDSDIEYYDITDYDAYRSQQAAWLKEVLKSDMYRNAPFKVIVGHIPPMGGWHGNLEVENKFMPLLREARPDVMLCGHEHQYIHQKADGRNPFPIVVNSNNTILKIQASTKDMKIEVVDENGKGIDTINLSK